MSKFDGVDFYNLDSLLTDEEKAVRDVVREGVIAAALTALMILLFLGSWRGTLIIALVGPPLANVALKFGSPEYFSLMVLGLVGSIVIALGAALSWTVRGTEPTADERERTLRLPMFLRLTRPLGEHVLAMALVDLQRLQEAQALFLPNTETALVVLRSDGVALSRRPESPGFVGRNLFEQFPSARRDLSGQEGFYATTGAATDGRARVGAFVTLDDFGLKLLLSDSEQAALTQHLRERTLLLAGSAKKSTVTRVIGSGWHSGIRSAVRLAP